MRHLRFALLFAAALAFLGGPTAFLSACAARDPVAVVDATLAATSAAAARLEPVLESEYAAAQRACPLTDDACIAGVRQSWARAWVAYRAFRTAWLAVDEGANLATGQAIDLCPLLDAGFQLDTAIGQLGAGAARSALVIGLVLDQVRILAPGCSTTRDGGPEGGVQR